MRDVPQKEDKCQRQGSRSHREERKQAERITVKRHSVIRASIIFQLNKRQLKWGEKGNIKHQGMCTKRKSQTTT